MHYELTELERIIANIPGAKGSMRHKAVRDKIDIVNVDSEIQKIKHKFIEASFQYPTERHFESYIQQHQFLLVRFADDIYALQEQLDKRTVAQKNSQDKRLYLSTLLETVIELLTWMQSQFQAFFNYDCPIPQTKKELVFQLVKRKNKSLQEHFIKNDISAHLINTILSPFHAFLHEDSKVSYRMLFFQEQLEKEVSLLAKKEHNRSSSDRVHEVLLYLNFNSEMYIRYWILRWHEEANLLPSIGQQIEFYNIALKKINQQVEKASFAFIATQPSAKSQLSHWISEELYFLEKKVQAMNIAGLAAPITDKEVKVQTCLPVAQLSLAVRLLIDSKVITNKNATELMRLVARNFKTDRRETISEDSLRNKAYNIESAAVSGMKDLIKGLMNTVGGY